MSDDYKSYDCYKILGIPWITSPQEIRTAYHKKCKECHPDVGGSHEQQIKVNLAYEILSNPLEREKHDRFWNYLYRSTPKSSPRTDTKKPAYEKYRQSSPKSTIQELFTRVTNVIDQELGRIRVEGERWVRSKISTYEEKVLTWRNEQERLFKRKLAEYEAKLNNLRQKQTTLFNKRIAGYDKLHSTNVKIHKILFYSAVSFSGAALLSIFIPIGFILLSFDAPLVFVGIAISTEMWASTAFLWVWYENSNWIKTRSKKIAVKDPNWRHKVIVILAHEQNSERMKVLNQEVTINASDCLYRIKNILLTELNAQKMSIGSCRISYDSNDWHQKVAGLAHEEYQRIAYKKEADLIAKRDRYLRNVAEICDMVERSSTLDSSEEQVARRIAVTFFMMGYVPISFNSQTRMFLFNDGEEKIVLRFRHRPGAPTNITFVKRMVDAMSITKAHKGFLFCTPGLSGNATDYAQSHSIKWYSLETMNAWIEGVLSSGYQGPKGDIFKHIDNMVYFLRRISLSLPSNSRYNY